MGRERIREEIARTNTQTNLVSANPDIEWALKEFSNNRNSEYLKYRSYYQGKQAKMIDDREANTTFGQKFKDFRINLCRPVVGALADRLQINNFSSPEEKQQKQEIEAMKREMEAKPTMPTPAEQWGDRTIGDLQADPGTKPVPEVVPPDAMSEEEKNAEIARLDGELENVPTASQEAWEIWEKNRMHRRAGQIHQEAIAAGDAYVLVWPNDAGDAIIYPQKAHEVRVEYDADNPGSIKKAAKMWQEDITIGGKKKKGVRITLYYTNRIEKWAAPKPDTGSGLKATQFKPYQQPGDPWKITHSYERVPIFHLANDADIGEYGRSELADATPIQDWINKTAFDTLTAQEHQAYPQRWFLNIEDPRKGANGALEVGRDRLWALRSAAQTSQDPQAQVGQFPAAELGGLTNILNQGAQAMAVTTGTPVHHFLPTLEGPSTPASGESQKTSDTKLQMKVSDRQTSFADVWSELIAFAVRIQRDESIENAVEIDVEWADLRPRNEREEVLMAIDKQKAGVTWQRTLTEMGYSEEDIEEFMHEKKKNAAEFGTPISGRMNPMQPDINDVMDQFSEATGMER